MTQHTDPAAPIRRSSVSWTLVGVFALVIAPAATADDAWRRRRVSRVRPRPRRRPPRGDASPRSLADWTEHRPEVRRRLARALGPVPDPPPPLEPTNHGTLDRDGYRVEKVDVPDARPGSG